MLDGHSRGPSLTLGMTDDFCHSERSRGISNHFLCPVGLVSDPSASLRFAQDDKLTSF
jgi:hypothetical protein